MCWTLDQTIQVQALVWSVGASGCVLRQDTTLVVLFSTLVYEWVAANLLMGVTL